MGGQGVGVRIFYLSADCWRTHSARTKNVVALFDWHLPKKMVTMLACYLHLQPMRRLTFEVISQTETKFPQSRKHGREKEKIKPSLMATSLCWHKHTARTKMVPIDVECK
jgi:hypothetical protein